MKNIIKILCSCGMLLAAGEIYSMTRSQLEQEIAALKVQLAKASPALRGGIRKKIADKEAQLPGIPSTGTPMTTTPPPVSTTPTGPSPEEIARQKQEQIRRDQELAQRLQREEQERERLRREQERQQQLAGADVVQLRATIADLRSTIGIKVVEQMAADTAIGKNKKTIERALDEWASVIGGWDKKELERAVNYIYDAK